MTFSIVNNQHGVTVYAGNDGWTEETIKALNRKGIYLDGCIGVMIHPDNKDLLVLGHEDDDVLYFKKNRNGAFDFCFHKHWARDLITSLKKALNHKGGRNGNGDV